MELLESIDGPMTLGDMISSLGSWDEISQAAFAKTLGVSRSHLCDVEMGRKVVSPKRAAAWAKVVGFPPTVYVKRHAQHQRPDGPLGVCNDAPCQEGQVTPCLRCVSQHS